MDFRYLTYKNIGEKKHDKVTGRRGVMFDRIKC